MILQNPEEYRLLGFEKSKNKDKKYDAILTNGIHIKKIPFGHPKYQHYRDSTNLKLYKHLDHYDKKRQALYRKRHAKDINSNLYSSGWFSNQFLWS